MQDTKNICNGSSSAGYRKERRRGVRYRISGMVWFQWQAPDGQRYEAIGITHDIGKAGLFVESASIPPVASHLNLVVALPGQENSRITLRLVGEGQVCHVGQGTSEPDGFGASSVLHVEMKPRGPANEAN